MPSVPSVRTITVDNAITAGATETTDIIAIPFAAETVTLFFSSTGDAEVIPQLSHNGTDWFDMWKIDGSAVLMLDTTGAVSLAFQLPMFAAPYLRFSVKNTTAGGTTYTIHVATRYAA